MIFYLLFILIGFAQDGGTPAVSDYCQKAIGGETSSSQEAKQDAKSNSRSKLSEAEIKGLASMCGKAQVLENCKSVKGELIFHIDKEAARPKGKRILVFSNIHGDEIPATILAKKWLARLAQIEPRNHWRIVPVLNPDGTAAKTRTNSRGVDLNRNFPTKDWNTAAQVNWKSLTAANSRRYPGPSGGSEPETQCAIHHIEDYHADLVVSIHSPLGVLDFDGPKYNFPRFKGGIKWVALGNFPGSLGRYMWKDRNQPVLTIELREKFQETQEEIDQLQDIIGKLALEIVNNPPGNRVK